MLVAMSGLGLLAVRSMQSINTSTVYIATNWLPSVRVLGALRADINLYRLTLRAHVMALSADGKAAVDKRMASMLDAVKKDIKTYQPLISNPDERRLHESWVKAWDN